LILGVVNFCICRHFFTFWVFGGSFFGVFIASFCNFTFGRFALAGLDNLLFLDWSITAFNVVGFGCLNWVAWRQLVGLVRVFFTFHFEFKVV
jgi:hypothetical protein